MGAQAEESQLPMLRFSRANKGEEPTSFLAFSPFGRLIVHPSVDLAILTHPGAFGGVFGACPAPESSCRTRLPFRSSEHGHRPLRQPMPNAPAHHG